MKLALIAFTIIVGLAVATHDNPDDCWRGSTAAAGIALCR